MTSHPSTAPSIPPPAADDLDSAVTQDREETKYVVDAAKGSRFARGLGAELKPHRFSGEGATTLPGAQFFTTTVYFDTKSRHLLAQAEDPDHLKVRAREYYTLHPSLAQLATDPRQLVRYSPVIWLELKYKLDGRGLKRRIGIPKQEIVPFFESGLVSDEMVALQREAHGEKAAAVLEEVTGLCRHFNEPMLASAIVNYRRFSWQDEGGDVRVTLDRNISLYRPPVDLWQREFALVRESLGQPVSTLEDYVIEVKVRGPVPSWLVELIEQCQLEASSFSKFVTAANAADGDTR